ncbi:MAG: SLATT domain-containing protein [Flammeovirgaceae bacterium]
MSEDITPNPDAHEEDDSNMVSHTHESDTLSDNSKKILSLDEEDGDEHFKIQGKFMADGYAYTMGPVSESRYQTPENEFTEAKIKLAYLKTLVEQKLKEYRAERKSARSWAFIFTMFSTIFAGAITVLLGWKFIDPNSTLNDTFANISLVLSAFITVLTVLSKFWDAKQLWVRYTDSESLLKQLLGFIEYTEQMGDLKALRLVEVEALHYKYESIVHATDELIHDVRSQN